MSVVWSRTNNTAELKALVERERKHERSSGRDKRGLVSSEEELGIPTVSDAGGEDLSS